MDDCLQDTFADLVRHLQGTVPHLQMQELTDDCLQDTLADLVHNTLTAGQLDRSSRDSNVGQLVRYDRNDRHLRARHDTCLQMQELTDECLQRTSLDLIHIIWTSSQLDRSRRVRDVGQLVRYDRNDRHLRAGHCKGNNWRILVIEVPLIDW